VWREEEGLGGELRRGFMRGRRCLDIKEGKKKREVRARPASEEESSLRAIQHGVLVVLPCWYLEAVRVQTFPYRPY
jgi:hypothetical protein